jgi:hypothetical protein
MLPLTRQLECLSCSNTRTFIHMMDGISRQLDQAAIAALPQGAAVACARCGSTSLIYGWHDAIRDASPNELRCRGRRPRGAVSPRAYRQSDTALPATG